MSVRSRGQSKLSERHPRCENPLHTPRLTSKRESFVSLESIANSRSKVPAPARPSLSARVVPSLTHSQVSTVSSASTP